jgi:penicillin-binding protein 1B
VAREAHSFPARRRRSRRFRWLWRAVLIAAGLGATAAAGALGFAYVWLSRLVDARLELGLVQVQPRVFARPFELRRGQALAQAELVDRLNDLGYTGRPQADQPGEFATGAAEVAIRVKGGALEGRLVRVVFRTEPARASPRRQPSSQILALEVAGGGRVNHVTFDPPLIAAIASGGREKRRRVPLARIPRVVRDAVLAIEDRRFYDHPGVDLLRTAGAILTNLRGERPYLVGGSTLTQQLVKNLFLTPEKTITRKLLEQSMAVILERRLTKDQILELYLNEVYLGQRGSFAIHGVAEAARLYFGKDVTNLTLAEAATLAGMIQAPPLYSPVRSAERARERRNVVLQAMVEAGLLAPEAARRASAEPLTTTPAGLEGEAPYFVDFIAQTLAEQFPGLTSRPVDVYTTLDIHLQRIAQDAVREGLAAVDARLARRRSRRAQAALLAADPRTGEILAFVGGRAYDASQFNRVVHARRQPGSVFKPFVYLAAFEAAAEEGRTDVTPATLLADEPATFLVGSDEWTPGNYEDEYEGVITARRALAMSRNLATIRMAERVGFEKVAAFWKRFGTSMPPRPYPSIALGVFEASPWEIAEAFTVFTNGGETRPLRAIVRLEQDGRALPLPPHPPPRRVARPDTTFLVTSMLQAVIDEGTGAGARAAGFTLPAAGKTGTTNDLRDAWFVGFTPELLAVVWVGHDDNQALGLSGAQAALPIWTAFMKRALAGRAAVPFGPPPDGVTVVEIDRDTGELAGPGCPRVISEAFLAGTEPTVLCALHDPSGPDAGRDR